MPSPKDCLNLLVKSSQWRLSSAWVNWSSRMSTKVGQVSSGPNWLAPGSMQWLQILWVSCFPPELGIGGGSGDCPSRWTLQLPNRPSLGLRVLKSTMVLPGREVQRNGLTLQCSVLVQRDCSVKSSLTAPLIVRWLPSYLVTSCKKGRTIKTNSF